MDKVELMSNHSAPYLTQHSKAPSPPSEYRRGRSYTTSIIPNVNTRRITKQPSPTTSDYVLHSTSKRLSTTSSDGSIHEPETMEEKWKKLKEMMTAVESMKSIVEYLFPAVETPEDNETHINFNTSQYEVELQLLRRTIDEQLHRMKVYFCEHKLHDNPRHEVEEMRLNIESNFKRMKVVVEGLIPSVNDLTKFRLDQIRNQISTIEKTVKQLAAARKSSDKYQMKSSFTADSSTNFQSQNALIRSNCSESRIRELEKELEASLEREEALRARIKKMEEGNDKEVAKVEEQRQLLCQILDKANLRANKAKNEAFELESKVAELTEKLMTKQYQLSGSKGKIAELEDKIADMRESESRTQLRRPVETFYSYRNTDNGYSSNVNNIKEQAPPIHKVTSPKSIPIRRQSNISSTSQRSNEDSHLPRKIRQVSFDRTSPVMDYMPTLKEYNQFTNMQSQRYMAMA